MKYEKEVAWGIKPINKEQIMAFELLMGPDISFVAISE